MFPNIRFFILFIFFLLYFGVSCLAVGVGHSFCCFGCGLLFGEWVFCWGGFCGIMISDGEVSKWS